jgi:hypothetical protein
LVLELFANGSPFGGGQEQWPEYRPYRPNGAVKAAVDFSGGEKGFASGGRVREPVDGATDFGPSKRDDYDVLGLALEDECGRVNE